MTHRKYDLIIFDWDGTIINSEAHIIFTMQKAIEKEDLEIPSEQSIRQIIGLSLPIAIDTLIPGISAESNQRISNRYKEYFFTEPGLTSELFDGASDIVKDLHADGYYLAVATGKGRQGLNKALQNSGLEPFFHITRCAEETRSKPDPLMLEEILTDLDMPPDKAIMVGDTSYDIEMARNIKMDSMAVTYGAHDKTQLQACNPTYFIDAIDQISQFV